MKPLIYLASPYNHASAEVREERLQAVAKAAAFFMNQGHVIYSPIVHNHPIATTYGLPKGWDYWQAFDEAMLSKCEALWILKLDGWLESEGIKGELAIAASLGLGINYIQQVGELYFVV